MVRDVLDHPSMPKGKHAPSSGTIDKTGDSWYVSYDEGDEDDDTEDDDTKYRASYQPPLLSPLKKALDDICYKIRKNENLQMQKYIIPRKSSPLASGLGSKPIPDEFYKPDLIINWDPIIQYPFFAVKYKCPKCKEQSMEKKGPCWRPALNWGDVHWIRCHRVSCTKCSATFMSTDSEIMESLPSAIVDDFGYVFPRRGPGVIIDMIRDLSLQTSNHILFGAWAKHVNDLIWQRYFRRKNQYMQLLKSWLDDWPSLATYDGVCPLHAWGYDGSPMAPYSAFGEPGHHNGILMTKNLARQLFYLVEGGKRMEYNQNSFGMNHDHGLRVDDTYKICKKVKVTTAGRQRVNPFSSAQTFVSQNGKIVAIAWKMSGSHNATRDILGGLKIVRNFVGAPPLKVLQTDNPVGEDAPFYETFPSLKEGTVAPTTLPSIEIPADDILTFDSAGAAHNFFLTLACSVPDNNRDMIYGLDTEFEMALPQELTVLSLAFPQSLVAVDGGRLPRAIVLHLHKMKGNFPESLKNLLQQKNWVPAGCQIGGDCSKLQEQYDITITRRIELQNLCKVDRPDLADVVGGYKLGTLMEQYLGCTYPMDKSMAQVQSYARDLSDLDKQYCALDALASLWVCQAAMASMAKVGDGGTRHLTLQVGKRCTVTFYGRDIAKGTVVFIGTSGEQRRWGGKTLGKSDCLVRVESLIDKKFEPKRREDWWPESAKTMEELSNCDGVTLELAMSVKQVKILAEVDATSEDGTSTDTCTEFEVDKRYVQSLIADQVGQQDDGGEVDQEDATTRKRPQEEESDGGEADQQDTCIQGPQESFLTRSVRDIFHQFHSIQLSKKSPAIAEIFRLVIAATWINNTEDFENVTTVLEAKGEDILTHEYFNRAYWRKRIRRLTPMPREHANNIRKVADIVRTDDVFKEHRTPALMQWFETFASNAEKGMYYKPADMDIYRLAGVDSDGLNIYTTDWGTNLNEVLHQKLADLLGLMAVGVETADILLILRAFRFNISAGIARCGEPDFHTDRHDIVDKTQHWIMHVFGIFAWPTHRNLLDFQPPMDSTLVGCRPLPFDPNHVTTAPQPAANLSHDHAYLSKKLGVSIAPLPLSSKEEFQLYNSLVRGIVARNRNPNNNDWDNIARDFKQKTDGLRIFPKTTDHLKKYFKTWKHLQTVKLFSRQAQHQTSTLLKQFRSVIVAPPKMITNELPTKVQTIGYTPGKPLEDMKNVPPPESAPTQESHVQLVPKAPKRLKLTKSDVIDGDAYQKLHDMNKEKLKFHAQRCAFYPFCQRQAWSCKGYNLEKECHFIKTLTPLKRRQIKDEIQNHKTSKRTLQRRRQRALAKCKDGRVDVRYVVHPQVVKGPYYSRRHGGYIVTVESLEEVATVGMPVRNEIIEAYLSLFINMMYASGRASSLGLVDPGFMGFLHEFGFGEVTDWLKKTDIQFIPAFFGPNDYGHWTAVIVEKIAGNEEGRPTVAFVDSLSDRSGRFRSVREDFKHSPYGEPHADLRMIDSPEQAAGSNDCAFFMIGAFTHWALRGTRDVPRKFDFRQPYDANQFGIEMRQHVFNSIVDCKVDLDAPVLRSMELFY